MASLTDFNQQKAAPKMSDFFAGTKTPSPVVNEDTINNVAAHTAALTQPEEMGQTYSKVSQDFQYGISSPTMNKVLGQWDAYDYGQTVEHVQSILQSEDYSIEQKEAAVQQLSSVKAPTSIYRRVAEASLLADSEPDDTDEAEFSRVDTSTLLDEVDVYNGMVQQQINQISNAHNPAVTETLKDLVEVMVPFYEQTNMAGLAATVADATEEGKIGAIAKALTAMGESKVGVREVIAKMPIEQRTKVAQLVIDYVKDSSGSEGLSPNRFVSINELNNMLTTGGYSGTDRFIDNLTSVLDDTIILSPFSKAVGGVLGSFGRIGKGVGTARSATAAIKRYETAAESLKSAELAGRVEKVLEDTSTIMSDAVAADAKLGARSNAEEMIVEDVLKQIPDDITVEVRADVTASVNKRMDEFIPGANTKQLTGDLLTDIQAAIAKRTIAGGSTDAAPDAIAVFRSNAKRDAVKSDVSPTSVGRVYNETNPAKARAALKNAADDETGRLAEAVFGTNRTEVISDAVLPEPHKADASVRQKVSTKDAFGAEPDASVINRVKENESDIVFTPAEKEALRAQVRDDWRDVVGLVPRTEMSTIEDIDRGSRMNMVYGPKDGGFTSARQALDQVRYGLRKYGVVDDDIEILTRDVNGYRPLQDGENWTKDGNYLARVKYDYQFASTDVRNFEALKGSWWKFADVRIPGTTGKAGGLTQHFVPSSTIINKALTNAASVASDFSAFLSRRLLELGKEYGDAYTALSKEQKYLVDSYILEANDKGLKFDTMRLKARGMNDKAVEALRQWKKNWDTIYHFENADANKNLKSRGYEKFVDQNGETDLIVRPLPRNQVAGSVRVYDTADGGKVFRMKREEVTKLYDEGGTIAQSRAPLEIEDDVVEYVVVRNNSTSSYTRAIREDDYTLSYRDGYYTVRYDAPFFITKKIRNKDGEEFEKAIATSGTRVDAERELARLRATDKKGEYDFRQSRDKEDFSNLEWSSVTSSGRTSQKVRGKRLKNVSETNPDLTFKHMDSPEESLVRSIQSVSNRVAFRDYLDTSKARWMQQFGNLLGGRKMWPEDVNLIGKGSASASRSDIADAVTMWRYIDSVESGYVDLLDDLTKTFFKGASDIAGRGGFKKLEELGRKAEQIDVNSFARRKAFRLLLSSNPIRQVMVQPSQALPVILAQNPAFILTGRAPAQLALMAYMRAGGDVNSFFKGMAETFTGLNIDEAKELIKNYRDSGIEDFVSAHTYMRDNMAGLINRKTSQKIGAAAGKPLDFTQKIGFEFGENILMSTVWLAEYDKIRRAGTKVNREVLDNLNAKVRNLTGNMNRAGEMPYNQNALSGVMQFFGTPHKIFAQVFMGHEGLTGMERSRLGAMYALTYGTGAGIITDNVLKLLPSEVDANVRDTVERGFANMGLNKMLTTLYGEEVNIAFSDSFRIGVAQPNIFQFMEDMVNLNVGEMIASSPSGAYVFGDNPKFNTFVHSLMRPFTVNDERKPAEMVETAKAFLNMMSGASNFMKAQYILAHGQKIGGTGKVVANDLNPVYALMQIAGFSSMQEVQHYAMQEKVYKTSSQPYDDVKGLVTETSRRLALEGISTQDIEYWLDIMSEAQRAWGNDVFMNQILMDELKNRTAAGETDFFDKLLKSTNFVSEGDLEDMLRTSNLPPETTDALREAARIIRESR